MDYTTTSYATDNWLTIVSLAIVFNSSTIVDEKSPSTTAYDASIFNDAEKTKLPESSFYIEEPVEDVTLSTVTGNTIITDEEVDATEPGMSTTPCPEPVSYTLSPYADDHLVNGFYIGMMFLMATSGTIGNTFIIGAVFVHKKLLVLSNAFIVNLAVTDFVVCAFVNVFTIVGVLTRGFFFHNRDGVCEFVGAICITSCCCSLWSIAAIAFNRYVIICHRIYYPTIFNKHTMPFFIIAVWVLSFLVDLPNLLGWGGHAFDKKALFCTYDFMAARLPLFYLLCDLAVCVAIPRPLVRIRAYCHVFAGY